MLRAFSLLRTFLILWIATAASAQDKPKIEVIYPLPNQRVSAVDSTFILGNVTPGSELKINKTPIKVYPNGAFLAFLPITSGKFVFNLEARRKGQVATREIPLEVPEPYFVPESLAISRGYMLPGSNSAVMEDDLVNVAFRGTPGLNAYFRASGNSSLIPMAESPPVAQSYWAQALFGAREVPESLLVRGSYNGNLVLNKSHVKDSLQFYFYLCRTPLPVQDTANSAFRSSVDSCECVSRINDSRLRVWPRDTVVVGELRDSAQTLRVGPRRGYFSVFQPKGIRLRVTGYQNGQYRARLANDDEVWIADSSVTILPVGAKIPSGEFALIRTRKSYDGVRVTFNPGALLPFDVDYNPLRQQLILDIYNCTSNIDWIRYDFSDSMIAAIDFEQVQPGKVQLQIDLNETVWGYECYYEGTQFNLKLNRRPHLTNKLQGVRVVVDPGHSPDAGAIGPSGYKEKDANLAISLELRERLEKAGAKVYMTREGDTPLPLYDRPILSYQFNADIFVSVHNNALPDGVNPFTNNGTATFYYHQQSQELAALVHRRMVKATELEDYGLYHGNFAVIRPTSYLSILVECAFMMIPEQEMALQTEEFREKIADAITDGIVDFVELEKERAEQGR